MVRKEPRTISETGRSEFLRKNRSTRAFTLLEILIVLSIIVLFSGLFALHFDARRSEETIAPLGREFQSLALKAKRRSFAYRRDQYLVIQDRTIILTESPKRSDPIAGAVERIGIPESVSLRIRSRHLFGDDNWIPANGFNWRFRRSGLNDPVTFRLSHDRSYLELDFDALPAIPAEASFYE